MLNIMSWLTLKKNVTTVHGTRGQRWLEKLPDTVKALTTYWSLQNIHDISSHMNYVASAHRASNQLVVLKIGCDPKEIAQEKTALDYFNKTGTGAIRLLDSQLDQNALLLEQALPGNTLSSTVSSYLTGAYKPIKSFLDNYALVVKKLHFDKLPTFEGEWPTIQDWLKDLEYPAETKYAQHWKTARLLKETLLQSMGPLTVLHGDLHHENILQYNKTWVAIDPKGVLGEVEFEAAAFEFSYVDKLAHHPQSHKSIQQHCIQLAERLQMNPSRLLQWTYVRLILMATWMIQDNQDPTSALQLADQVHRLIT